MTKIAKIDGGVGQIQIADEVIATIAGTAALEVEGVADLSGHFASDVAEMLNKRNFSKGVKITVNEGVVTVDMNITVKFGYKIQDVSANVQARVKEAIETMTGLGFGAANVFVSGIMQEKERAK